MKQPPFDPTQLEQRWQECLAAAAARFETGEFNDIGVSDSDVQWMGEIEGVPSDVAISFFSNIRPGRGDRRLVEATWRVTVWPIGEEEQDGPWELVDHDFEYLVGGIQETPTAEHILARAWPEAASALRACGPFMSRIDAAALEARLPAAQAGRPPRI